MEYWQSLTDDNEHNRARIEICGWLLRRLHDANRKATAQAENDLVKIHKIFAAIETIADAIGHMTADLLELRYSKTRHMVEIVRRVDSELADIIDRSL